MSEILSVLIGLLLGFGLGISSPLLGDWIDDRRKL